MISASSFWGRIEEMVLRVVAGILDRAVCHLRLGSIAGLVLLCGSLSGWIGPVGVAQAEEALPDGRVFEMVTPPSNQDADVYVPFAFEAPIGQGVQTFFPFQVALDGSAVTYVGDATTGGEGEGGAWSWGPVSRAAYRDGLAAERDPTRLPPQDAFPGVLERSVDRGARLG